MKHYGPAAKLSIFVVTVLLSAIALALLFDQQPPSAETAPTFFQVGQTYAVNWGFCRKVRFLGQNPKIGCHEFNDLQTPKLSKKQLCDRTCERRCEANVAATHCPIERLLYP